MYSLVYFMRYLEAEPDLYFISQNAYKVSETYDTFGLMLDENIYFDYRFPRGALIQWLGIYPPHFKVQRLSNYFLAPGTMYKRKLHDLIGPPDIETFLAAADLEYWLRILYNNYKGHYISTPTWFYRMSNYSTHNEIIDGVVNDGGFENPGHEQAAGNRVQDKYTKLVEENKEKFI